MANNKYSLFQQFKTPFHSVEEIVKKALRKKDDGEIFLEYSENETLVLENKILKIASFNQDRGFGLRAIDHETTSYAHSSGFSLNDLKDAASAVHNASKMENKTYAIRANSEPHQLYAPINPIDSPSFQEKITLLEKIDQYIRNQYENLVQVKIALTSSFQHVEILRLDRPLLTDSRPLTRIAISIIIQKEAQCQTGFYAYGGRESFEVFLKDALWKAAADKALHIAKINLEAEEAPAGKFDVVLANGWPGIMIHEAVGHGLEGDFNRKKTSAFSGKLGQKIACEKVTIVDDGTLEKKRGSLNFDDEGTKTKCTTLIEEGILVNYMQDRLNARLMNMESTGNGRRESYAYAPLPRMTNTIMLSGKETPEEIIGSVKNGIYAVSFGGGQVDITSGKFVFECTEAYRIENGKIGAPIKGATLIGTGKDAMNAITMVGNDSLLDSGIGTCGKAGQSVPVGVGQPHLRIDGLTLGGTKI